MTRTTADEIRGSMVRRSGPLLGLGAILNSPRPAQSRLSIKRERKRSAIGYERGSVRDRIVHGACVVQNAP